MIWIKAQNGALNNMDEFVKKQRVPIADNLTTVSRDDDCIVKRDCPGMGHVERRLNPKTPKKRVEPWIRNG